MSKALPLVIGVVAVVAAAATGGAWYTGTQVEPLLRQQVVDTNQYVKTALAGVSASAEIEMTGFERHLFSTTAHYVATVQSPGINEGQPLRMDAVANIEHGPLPWSRLAKLKLLPVMATTDYRVEGSPQLAQVLGVPEGQAPVQVRATLGYGGGVEGQMRMAPSEVQTAEATLRLSPLEATFEGTRDGKKLVVDTALSSLEYTAADPRGPVTMQLQGVKLHTGGIKGESGFDLGNNQAEVARWLLSSRAGPVVELNKLTGVGSTEELNGKLKASADYRFEQMSIAGKPVGSGQMRWLFDNLDIAASRDLLAFYERVVVPQAQATSQAHLPFQPRFSPQQAAEGQAILERLLEGRPRIELQQLGLKTANGESHLSIALDFAKPANPNVPPAALAQQLVSQLDAKLTVAKGTIRDISTLQGQLGGITDPATLAENADGAATMAATLATLQGLARVEDDNIVSTLHYEAGMVDFNGQKMTVEAFAAFLMGAFGKE